jgi:type III restriction enzyme
MANESYEDFAKQLQKEIEQEEGIKFNVVEPHTFANIPVQNEEGEAEMLGVETSEKIWKHLKEQEYIDKRGKVQDKLRMELKHNVLDLPEEVEEQSAQIKGLLKKISGKLNIKNADNKRTVKPKKEVLLSDDFKDLWNRIKYKTTYRVEFDTEELIEACANELRDKLRVGKARFKYQKAKAEIDRGGVHTELASESEHTYDATDFPLPDIISILQNETNLTRKTLAEILIRSERLSAFTNNPQKFIEQSLGFIKDKMRTMIVDGIKYHKIGDESYSKVKSLPVI